MAAVVETSKIVGCGAHGKNLVMTHHSDKSNEIPSNRIWLGPNGEIIDVCALDVSHSGCVANSPATFGLDAEAFASVDLIDEEGEFDFDTVIALAQTNGWIRVSTDSFKNKQGMLSISAGNADAVRRGIRHLHRIGVLIDSAEISIERFQGETIVGSFHVLDELALKRFLRGGQLPASAYVSAIPVTNTALFRKVTMPSEQPRSVSFTR